MAANRATIRCRMVITACRMSYLTIGGSAVPLVWIAPEPATDMRMRTGQCGRCGPIRMPTHTATLWMPTDDLIGMETLRLAAAREESG